MDSFLFQTVVAGTVRFFEVRFRYNCFLTWRCP